MEKIKVGIPRALLYYNYLPLWKVFFESLGAEVIISDKTTKSILNNGVKEAVDDVCLPVKIYFGHVINLINKVDYIFLPRLVSVEKKEYICPKFLGLPDMVKVNIKDLPRVIDTNIDLSKNNRNLFKSIYEVGKIFTENPLKIIAAYQKGLKEWKLFKKYLYKGMTPDEAIKALEKGEFAVEKVKTSKLTIAVIGHGYNLYDDYINMNIINKLRKMGIQVLTPDNIPDEIINQNAKSLPKKLFWTMGKHLIGATFYLLSKPEINGIIHITAFGCGIDSIVGELIERKIRKEKEVPFMVLTLDEHTGEAGVITRLEAFTDMIKWRDVNKNESNLSSHGKYVYSH